MHTNEAREPERKNNGLVITPARTHEVLDAASELYSRVFGYDAATYTLNTKLLLGMIHNGGTAIAANNAAGDLVGFTYGFTGHSDGVVYHYSQAAFVDPALQGQGVGRLLKEAQRDAVLEQGLTTMRWAYDPMLSRNAHFNLGVLGARARWFVPNLYDEPGSDRFVVEWNLLRSGDARAAAAVPPEGLSRDDWAIRQDDGDRVWLPIPASLASVGGSPADSVRLRDRLGVTLRELLAEGYSASDCTRIDADTASYLFTRDAPAAASAPTITQDERG